MRVAVIGAGAVGARLARLLVSSRRNVEVVIVDQRHDVADAVVRSLGGSASVPVRTVRRSRLGSGPDLVDLSPDVAVVCTAAGSQVALAERSVEVGCPVVSVADAIDDVEGLLSLDAEARAAGVPVIVGAGFSPGLTCLLARSISADLDQVDEIHVAKAGTGGPDCARQHHRALKSAGIDWRDGAWQRRAGGSGRELCWFPSPVDGRDCYRAALPEPLVLVPSFPDVSRITARVWATRRDRLTMHLPMLRAPHPEGLMGAVRVEVRGVRDGEQVVDVRGCAAPPAVAAATVAAAVTLAVASGTVAPGAHGVAAVDRPGQLLAEIGDLGLKIAAFTGPAALGR